MSTTTRRPVAYDRDRRVSTETKASFKTTELIAYLATVAGILIASAVVDNNDADNLTGFDARQAWTLITFLTIGYMISRGLAKSGSREFYDDTHDSHDTHNHNDDASTTGSRGTPATSRTVGTTGTPSTPSTGTSSTTATPRSGDRDLGTP